MDIPKINKSAGKITFIEKCMFNTCVNDIGSAAVIEFKAIVWGMNNISSQKTYRYDPNVNQIMSGVEIDSRKVLNKKIGVVKKWLKK